MSSLIVNRDDLPAALERWRSPLTVIASGLAQIVLAAGAVVMEVYERGAIVRTKLDQSPVCDADERAELLIQAELARFLPTVPVLAEEAASRGDKPAIDGQFLLVDPVDGTKEFLGHNGEFTVNIALVEDGVPRAGAVYAPALRKLWFAGDHAFACTVDPNTTLRNVTDIARIETRSAPASGLAVMASRSHADAKTDEFLSHLPVAERRSAGSSLKFCALAEGQADLYPRFGPTMEWDTAAGDAVLRAAGGVVLSEDGGDLRYGKALDNFRNGGFIAWGRRADAARLTPSVLQPSR